MGLTVDFVALSHRASFLYSIENTIILHPKLRCIKQLVHVHTHLLAGTMELSTLVTISSRLLPFKLVYNWTAAGVHVWWYCPRGSWGITCALGGSQAIVRSCCASTRYPVKTIS